ncbi:MAG TPA: acyl-CoA dehydrogenase family protein [Myxococcota bacterium]|jgi:citronellyl-CoA dehydrogenase|nr:acyl-CoA dehydrogenase family protein [Myxococcota bacterium]
MPVPNFTPDHEIFRKTVRDFAEKELLPHAEEWDVKEEFPKEIFKRAGALGLLGIRHPTDYGGSGGDYWYTVAYAEELARCGAHGVAMALMVQSDMATPVIADIGTDEQKKEFLAPAIRGDSIAALGVSEPGAGSDVAGIRTTARRVDGDWVINGQKTFITNGARADFVTLAVRTGGEGYGGVSFVLFPTDTKGFRVGRKLRKIGNKCSDTAELYFEDCRIPARNLLGEENHGFYYVMRNFQGERLIAAISTTAGAALALEQTIAYTKERKAFGRPIASFQVWKHRFAEMATQLEAARRFVYYVCDLFDRGQECVKEISMAKLFCGDLAVRVVDQCLQAHGGYGYIEDYPIARAWRDVRLITIGGGTSEIMKEIIAKTMGL